MWLTLVGKAGDMNKAKHELLSGYEDKSRVDDENVTALPTRTEWDVLKEGLKGWEHGQ